MKKFLVFFLLTVFLFSGLFSSNVFAGDSASSITYKVKEFKNGKWEKSYSSRTIDEVINDAPQGVRIYSVPSKTYFFYRVKISPKTGWLSWVSSKTRTGFNMDGKKIVNIQIATTKKTKGAFPWGEQTDYSKRAYIVQNKTLYNSPKETGSTKKGTAKSLKILTEYNSSKRAADKIKIQIKTKTIVKDGTYYSIYYKNKLKGYIKAAAFVPTYIRYVALEPEKVKATKNFYFYTFKDNAIVKSKVGKINKKGKTLKIVAKFRTSLAESFFLLKDGTFVYSNNFKLVMDDMPKANAKTEKMIAKGLTLVKKSKYLWGGGRTSYWVKRKRFDCSSFIYYCAKYAGKTCGPMSSVVGITFLNYGKKVKYKDLKRGEVLFFSEVPGGKSCGHVAIYLGGKNKLFLHDSPSTDSGGVDIDSLKEGYWPKLLMHGNRIPRKLF